MSIPEPSPMRLRLLTGALLVGVFAAGTVTGAALYRWARAATTPPLPLHAAPPIPLDDLELSDLQRDRIWQVIDKYRPELDAIVGATIPKVKEVHARMQTDVRALLTPPQRQSFDLLVSRRFGPPSPHPRPWTRDEGNLTPPPPLAFELGSAPTTVASSHEPPLPPSPAER
jgi:Spy/CpxP family protein refolding chaperone